MSEDGQFTKITSTLYEPDKNGVFVFIPNVGTVSVGGGKTDQRKTYK